MRAGPDSEVDRLDSDAEVLEENVGHRRVVVLTGVHELGCKASALLHRMDYRSNLDEIRAGADDEHRSWKSPSHSAE